MSRPMPRTKDRVQDQLTLPTVRATAVADVNTPSPTRKTEVAGFSPAGSRSRGLVGETPIKRARGSAILPGALNLKSGAFEARPNADEGLPPGWWILPALFVGLAGWFMILKWIYGSVLGDV